MSHWACLSFHSQIIMSHHYQLIGQKTLLVLPQFTFSNLPPAFSYHFLCPSWNPHYLSLKPLQFLPNWYLGSFPSNTSYVLPPTWFCETDQTSVTPLPHSFQWVSFTSSAMSHLLNLLLKFLNNTAFTYPSSLNSLSTTIFLSVLRKWPYLTTLTSRWFVCFNL